MSTLFPTRLISALLVTASIVGCRSQRTVREYTQARGGQVIIKDVSEEDYWKRQVDEHITAEAKGEKPPGYETWRNYYEWWFGVIRRKSKPPWKSTDFKTSEDMVTYIKEKRRARRLPDYE